jgi:hypothetical protein
MHGSRWMLVVASCALLAPGAVAAQQRPVSEWASSLRWRPALVPGAPGLRQPSGWGLASTGRQSFERSRSTRAHDALRGALLYGLSRTEVAGPLLASDCHRIHPGYPYACSQGRDVPRSGSSVLIGLPFAALRGWMGWESEVERLWRAAPPPPPGIR